MSIPREQRSANGRAGVLTMWSQCSDWSARTEPARQRFLERFMPEDPEGTLGEEQKMRMAQAARKAYFTKLAIKSARARRQAAAAKAQVAADQAQAELDEAEAELAAVMAHQGGGSVTR